MDNHQIPPTAPIKPRRTRLTLISVVTITGFIISVIPILFLIFNDFNKSYIEDMIANNEVAKAEIHSLNMELTLQKNRLNMIHVSYDSLLKSIPYTKKKGLVKESEKESKYNTRISKLERKLAQQEKTIGALRQAINPIHPEEVLTIARLKDEINDMRKQSKYFEDAIKKQEQELSHSIEHQLDSSGHMTEIIIAAMLPILLTIVINFLDRRKALQTQSVNSTSTGSIPTTPPIASTSPAPDAPTK